ncbi:Eco57I restriction-modification methylase domain-containing protein [Prevotella intermedia]|uniref:site-specific DNA-methyltransferase (adenine-specific) n=1 Tax=Prevotella intermedia TaxID=28131 RepID=A0A2D3LNM2_PREIN|nr:N-6 DNA methylase [Prevotella intermedia]ATV32196.1 DNA modification methylase [Prevotella intermedia]PJI21683.1 DNA modification methylase [Prevotella intermedia]
METLSIETLKGYLSSQYKGWSSFVNNIIFPIFGEDNFESLSETELLENNPEEKPLAEATGICSIKQVGQIDIGVQPLQIFDVTVSDRVMMERNRVNIQRLIRKVMENYSCAFMLFHYENDTRWDWRFTFCHKKGSQKDVTDSKRYTFLLGPGQSCRTAAENFKKLYDKRDTYSIKDIEDAFNVEALSKEFFWKYKAQYEAFVNYMVDPANGMRQNFIDTDFDHAGMTADKVRDREEKPIRNYVKKLLGRIVFLHFLQKKGWLGVPAGKDWGKGDCNFILHLFENASEEQKENFLDAILENLFSEGLDKNRSEKNDLYDTKVEGFRNCRIPYLNGGLFERDYLDELAVKFPAEYFDNLLTMLSQYNFTIDENDPNDAEVGVDPEMLGRIFENLLEDNKDKGAFYTPKEIVQYMCRESLIAYLQTDQNEEDKETIRKFVTTHDAELLGDLKANVEQKLLDVKICDPAIGSGAFPMGLLRELFLCRSAIEPNIIENAANIKRYIIQNNIYGVDIERGAVDIARLRFWLALIVDEKTPEALPNLDFKIMQGNSLLEQYNGADLSNMTEKKVGAEQSCSIFDSMLDVYRRNLRNKLSEYYSCPEHTKKVQLRKDIADIVKQELTEQGINIDFEDMDLSANSQFFLWHTWFHDVFSRPSKEGFDIVIGNPPYVKEYVNRHAFDGFRETSSYYMGKMDLWYGFACHSIDLLCQGGHLCFIAQNNWTTSAGAKKMRSKIVSDARILQILDFNTYMVFENADIQTMIMLFEKNQIADNYEFDYRILMEGANKEDMLALLNKQIRRTIYRTQKFNRTKYANKLFTFSDNELIFDKISENKTYLQNDEATNGIHTHHDCVNNKIHRQFPDLEVGKGIFVLSSEEKESLNLTTVEESLIKPFFSSDEIFRFHTLNKNKSWIIYTDSQYKNIHSMDQYPHIKKHLDIVGKAITSDNRPYGLHRARESRFFIGEKIVSLRKCVERPCFSFSDFDCYVPAMYYVIKSSRWDMKFLTGVLNSKLVAFWLRHKGKMQGSNYQVDKEPLQRIPLPIVSPAQQQPIINLVDTILSTKKTKPQADTSELENEIDNLIYNLYSLSNDEIKIVEGI